MKIGDLFNTYDDFVSALDKYKTENNVEFQISDSRSLERGKKYCPIKVASVEKSLKYDYVKFRCVHGGKFKKKKGSTGIRKTSTLKQGCGAFIFVKPDDTMKQLVISNMSEIHNHEISEILFKSLPSQRKLTPALQKEVTELVNMKANKKLIQDKIQRTTGGVLSLKDISNIAASGKCKNCNNLDDVIKQLEQKHESAVLLSVDEEKNLLGIYIQDNEMRKAFSSYPEVIFADSTYKLLDLRIPVFVLLIEDGNGESEVAAIGLLVHEDERTLKWFFETFKLLNQATERTKTVMTDKDLTERSVIKKVFPNVNLRICLFHAFRTFDRQITCEKMGITANEKIYLKELFGKLCYARTEEEYETLYQQLLRTAPKQVIDYFKQNWHGIKNEWTAIATFNTETYLNKTNNRLESLNSKIKSVVPRFSSLEEFVEKLFILLKCIRSERDIRAAQIIQRVPTDNFNSEDEKKYFNFLTPYANKFVQKQIHSLNTVRDTESKLNTTSNMCTCLFHTAMFLPCKYIFAFRKKNNFPLFDECLCDQRWSRRYYFQNHRVYRHEENSSSNDHFDTYDDTVPAISTLPVRATATLTTHQKFKKVSLLTNKIAALVSEYSNIHFERKIGILEALLDKWSKGKEVMIQEIPDLEQEYLETEEIILSEKEASNSVVDNNSTQLDTSQNKAVLFTDKESEVYFALPTCSSADIKNSNSERMLEDLEISDGLIFSQSSNDCMGNVYEEASISIQDIKLPTKLKMRGRPKGVTLTAIGLPRKNVKNKKPLAFSKKHYKDRERLLLSWFVDGSILERVFKNNHIIEEHEIECRPDKLHTGVLDDAVDINLIRPYFTDDGWTVVLSVLREKRGNCLWVCSVCQEGIGLSKAIECSSCLSWFHYFCVNIIVKPRSKEWFCRNCYE